MEFYSLEILIWQSLFCWVVSGFVPLSLRSVGSCRLFGFFEVGDFKPPTRVLNPRTMKRCSQRRRKCPAGAPKAMKRQVVLFGGIARKTEGDSWFTLLHFAKGAKRTPMAMSFDWGTSLKMGGWTYVCHFFVASSPIFVGVYRARRDKGA